MKENLPAAKREVRRAVREAWRRVTPQERASASASAMEVLRSRPEWEKARHVMLYAPLADELDVWSLVAEALGQERTVSLPRFVPGQGAYEAARIRDLGLDIVDGHMGIREPTATCPALPWTDLDLVLVPGRAFDPGGQRLGRGKGFYDQMLSTVRCATCGVAMDWQVLPEVPAAAHDRRVNFLLTPTRWVECPSAAT